MNDLKIMQIYNVSDNLVDICFNMVKLFNWDKEDKKEFGQIIQYGVNSLAEPMLISSVDNKINGFIKGAYIPLPMSADRNLQKLKALKIDWLCVEPNSRKKNVGTRLVQAYTDYAQAEGVELLYLKSLMNKNTQHFWKAQKFQTIGWDKLMGKLISEQKTMKW